jgi:hypothetical protein
MYSLKFSYEIIYLSVSYDFMKFDGSIEIKGVTFLMVPHNDWFAFIFLLFTFINVQISFFKKEVKLRVLC